MDLPVPEDMEGKVIG
jgi:adenylyl-sulfate kinase